MVINSQGTAILETPFGKGWVFKGDKQIAEVYYELQIIQSVGNENFGKLIVTGRIKRVDQANIRWSSEYLTLHLEDKRKLDFICVNYDPDCNISSDKGFYT